MMNPIEEKTFAQKEEAFWMLSDVCCHSIGPRETCWRIDGLWCSDKRDSSIVVQEREWFGLQNFLAQAKVSEFDCMIGSGTERPP